MTIVQLLTDYLATTLGKSDETFAPLVFKLDADGKPTDELADNALEALTTLHAEHISKAGAEVSKAEQDRIHKEAKFQALSQAEEKTRKAYGVEGKDLAEIIANVAKNATTKAGSEDSVIIHPLYLKLKSEKEEELATAKTQAQAEIQAAKSGAEKQMRFNQTLPEIEAALVKAGVSLDTMKPATRRAYLAQFEGMDFEKTEAGTFIKDAAGSLLKDKHQNPLKLEQHIAQDAPNWFDIPLQPARQSPGNESTGAAPAPTEWAKSVPTDSKQVNAWLETVPAEQQGEAMKLFQAQKG